MPVVVVGDTHGQLHDLLHMLEITGAYSGRNMYIFNGVCRHPAWLALPIPVIVHCAGQGNLLNEHDEDTAVGWCFLSL
jgi:hypothetical protein